MREFDANENGVNGFCTSCIHDDRIEDHESDCCCTCHFSARIEHLTSLLSTEREESIGLQQEINCLRMEPCHLPHCVKERDLWKSKAERLKIVIVNLLFGIERNWDSTFHKGSFIATAKEAISEFEGKEK